MIHMILSAGVRLHFRAALDPFTRAMPPSVHLHEDNASIRHPPAYALGRFSIAWMRPTRKR